MSECTVPWSAQDNVIKPELLGIWATFSSELIWFSPKLNEHIELGLLGEKADPRTGSKKAHQEPGTTPLPEGKDNANMIKRTWWPAYTSSSLGKQGTIWASACNTNNVSCPIIHWIRFKIKSPYLGLSGSLVVRHLLSMRVNPQHHKHTQKVHPHYIREQRKKENSFS